MGAGAAKIGAGEVASTFVRKSSFDSHMYVWGFWRTMAHKLLVSQCVRSERATRQRLREAATFCYRR
jgi:hypothetical protein